MDENSWLYQWLQGFSLAEYYHLLSSAGYRSPQSMVGITKEKLKQIGITKLGHVTRLVNGIAKLNAGGGAPGPSPHPHLEDLGQTASQLWTNPVDGGPSSSPADGGSHPRPPGGQPHPPDGQPRPLGGQMHPPGGQSRPLGGQPSHSLSVDSGFPDPPKQPVGPPKPKPRTRGESMYIHSSRSDGLGIAPSMGGVNSLSMAAGTSPRGNVPADNPAGVSLASTTPPRAGASLSTSPRGGGPPSIPQRGGVASSTPITTYVTSSSRTPPTIPSMPTVERDTNASGVVFELENVPMPPLSDAVKGPLPPPLPPTSSAQPTVPAPSPVPREASPSPNTTQPDTTPTNLAGIVLGSPAGPGPAVVMRTSERGVAPRPPDRRQSLAISSYSQAEGNATTPVVPAKETRAISPPPPPPPRQATGSRAISPPPPPPQRKITLEVNNTSTLPPFTPPPEEMVSPLPPKETSLPSLPPFTPLPPSEMPEVPPVRTKETSPPPFAPPPPPRRASEVPPVQVMSPLPPKETSLPSLPPFSPLPPSEMPEVPPVRTKETSPPPFAPPPPPRRASEVPPVKVMPPLPPKETSPSLFTSPPPSQMPEASPVKIMPPLPPKETAPLQSLPPLPPFTPPPPPQMPEASPVKTMPPLPPKETAPLQSLPPLPPFTPPPPPQMPETSPVKIMPPLPPKETAPLQSLPPLPPFTPPPPPQRASEVPPVKMMPPLPPKETSPSLFTSPVPSFVPPLRQDTTTPSLPLKETTQPPLPPLPPFTPPPPPQRVPSVKMMSPLPPKEISPPRFAPPIPPPRSSEVKATPPLTLDEATLTPPLSPPRQSQRPPCIQPSWASTSGFQEQEPSPWESNPTSPEVLSPISPQVSSPISPQVPSPISPQVPSPISPVYVNADRVLTKQYSGPTLPPAADTSDSEDDLGTKRIILPSSGSLDNIMLTHPLSHSGSPEHLDRTQVRGGDPRYRVMPGPSSPDYENVDGECGSGPVQPVRITGTGTIRSRTLPTGSANLKCNMADLDYENQDVINEDIIPFQVMSDAGSAASFEFSTDSETGLSRSVSSSIAPPTSHEHSKSMMKSSGISFKHQASSDTIRSEDSSNFSSGSSTTSSPTLATKHGFNEVSAAEHQSASYGYQDSGMILSKSTSEAVIGPHSFNHQRMMSFSDAISPVYSRLESQRLSQVGGGAVLY